MTVASVFLQIRLHFLIKTDKNLRSNNSHLTLKGQISFSVCLQTLCPLISDAVPSGWTSGKIRVFKIFMSLQPLKIL